MVRNAEVRCPIDFHGTIQLLQRVFSHGAIVAEAFDFEKTSVGLKADLPQSRQVTQPFADVEVTRVVDGRFRTGSHLDYIGNPLDVLFDAGVLVIHMQGWNHALGQHPGSKAPRRVFGHATIKDQLHHVWTANIKVLADDLLE